MIISKELKNFLKKAISLLSSSKQSIIEGVVIDRRNGTVTASNGFVQMVYNTEDYKKDECFIIPIKAMQFLLSFDDGKTVELDYDETNKIVTIKCGKSRSKFPLLDLSAYPFMDVNVSEWESIDTNTIELLIQTSINADIRAAVLAARSISIVDYENKTYCYSCDGRCLTTAEIAVSNKYVGINIPVNITPFISEFRNGENIQMGITQNGRKFVLKKNDMLMTACLLDGSRMNLIPQLKLAQQNANVCKVNKKELLSVLQRASIVSDNKRIILTFAENGIHIRLHDTVVEFEDSVNVLQSQFREEKEVCLYVNQLIEQLSCQEDEVTIYSKDKLNPIVITGNGISSLIMPIKM